MSYLPDQPLWRVQDSSKIQDYMTCPRKYLFRHVMGWEPNTPNVHLEFGTAVHLALEHLHSHDYSLASQAEAFLLFEQHYRRHFDPGWDEGNSPKNPACALRLISRYCEHYASDDFDVLHTEVSGSVAVGQDRVVHFKTDTLCHGSEGYFSLEHKTGSRFSSSWAAQWRLKLQVGVYSHVLYCLYPASEIYGVKINGLFPAPTPKLRKDGQPYAGSRDVELHRLPVRLNLPAMESWLEETNAWLDRIDEDFSRLSESSSELPTLPCFRRNRESCTHYGQCPYLDWCSIWHNPIGRAEEPPSEFRVNFWDPRSIEYTKQTMEL